MFAHNNGSIDYFRMAVMNALLAQKHLGLTADQITIVSNSQTIENANNTLDKTLIESASSNILCIEKDSDFENKNIKVYKDSIQSAEKLSFYNVDRCDAFELSPYDETILIDCDYLIFSDSLNRCWGHKNDLMMNYEFNDIYAGRKFRGLDRISPTGPNMYWATVVYFQKTAYAESFFEIVKYVRDNPEYHKDLYDWNTKFYRNDYSFSIAAHMLGGFQNCAVHQLPVTLHKTFDVDDIYDVMSADEVVFYLQKPTAPNEFILTNWKGVDIHVMNKWAIDRISGKLMELLIPDQEGKSGSNSKAAKKKSVKRKTT